MEKINKKLIKGLLAALTLALSNDHLLGADQTNRMLLLGILMLLAFIFSPEQLNDTVQEVTGGNSTIDSNLFNNPILVENLMKTIQSIPNKNEIESTISPLTPREKEVLNYMADGLMNKEIAKKMGLREGTVKCHVKSIFDKFNVNVRTEAVVLAIKNGFIDVNNTLLVQDSTKQLS